MSGPGQVVIPIPPNYTVVGSAISHAQSLHRLTVNYLVNPGPSGPEPPSPPQVLLGGGENGPFYDERTRQPAGIFVGPQPQGVQELLVRVENKPADSKDFVPSIVPPPFVVEKRPMGDSKEAYLIYTTGIYNVWRQQILTEDGSDRDFNDIVVTIVAVQNQDVQNQA
ncbi:hypothetical protein H0H93_006376 [Arthromyces matolae]|nr:hypothetical protein H0H93_006376 [Arthromyces matolae]